MLREPNAYAEEDGIRLALVLGSSAAGFLLGGPVVAIVAAVLAPVGLLLARSLRRPSVARGDRAAR